VLIHSGIGLKVVLADINEAVISRAAEALRSKYPSSEAIGVKCDVSKESDIEAMIAAAVERWGRLDVLVRCATAAAHTRGGWLTIVQQRGDHAPGGWRRGRDGGEDMGPDAEYQRQGGLVWVQACYPGDEEGESSAGSRELRVASRESRTARVGADGQNKADPTKGLGTGGSIINTASMVAVVGAATPQLACELLPGSHLAPFQADGRHRIQGRRTRPDS